MRPSEDRRRPVGQDDDEPGPAGDGGEVAVQGGLELEGGGGLARAFAHLEGELAGGDRIRTRADDDQPIRAGHRRRDLRRAMGVLADVEDGADGRGVEP